MKHIKIIKSDRFCIVILIENVLLSAVALYLFIILLIHVLISSTLKKCSTYKWIVSDLHRINSMAREVIRENKKQLNRAATISI